MSLLLRISTDVEFDRCSLLWSLASIPLGVYVIVQNLNIPLIIQPELFGAFTLISWTQVCSSISVPELQIESLLVQCMYYNEGRSLRWCLTMLIAVSCISAGLQVGFVFALRVRCLHGYLFS